MDATRLKTEYAMIPCQKQGNFAIHYDRHGVCSLWEGNFLWMLDFPDAYPFHQQAIDACGGRVLKGGLGLGYVVGELLKKKNVTEVVVVEKSQEVIDLVWPSLDTKGKCSIVCDDVFNYLKTTQEVFDYISLDVHRDLSLEQYEQVVLPLRALAEKIVPAENVLIWRENEMRQKHE